MANLHRIITEVINNQVLFSDLSIHASNLERFNQNMRRSNTNNNPEISQFLSELYTFTLELVNALKRCVNKKSLNEANYGGFGFANAPVYSDLYYSMVNGFNNDVMGNIRNKWDRIKGNGNGVTSGSRYNGRGTKLPKNQTLQTLLTQYYPLVQQKYVKLNRKYGNAVENMNPPSPKFIIGEIEAVITTINNAQGSNP